MDSTSGKISLIGYMSNFFNPCYYTFQRTFVGVDFFIVFQEVYLRSSDPRVCNIVKFSDAIGELKVEVILNNFISID